MAVERALLITVQFDGRTASSRPPQPGSTGRRTDGLWSLEDEAQELKELVVSSGCRVVGEITARRHQPIAGTFIGEGKLEEIAQAVARMRAHVVVFNQELSPAQQRNIEAAVGTKTIDRTQLILDIFAQRATSQEGKVQVELAQLRYLMPRLVGQGVMLSRLGGGIGTRGPGEQKLEIDRRRIRDQIARLGDELHALGRRRGAVRLRRKETQVPVAALIGYTNAGKTTLLNRLSGEAATAKDQLFTTLDPLARRVKLSGMEAVIVTDTVGFLHHLPHHLIEAFKATLEEARDADLLLHVLDVSHPLLAEHAGAVEQVLQSLELSQKPILTVLNKCDRLDQEAHRETLERVYSPGCGISAKTGQGIDRLLKLIEERLSGTMAAPIRVRVPAERSDLIASIYRHGRVIHRQDHDGTVELTARIPASLQASLISYIIHP